MFFTLSLHQILFLFCTSGTSQPSRIPSSCYSFPSSPPQPPMPNDSHPKWRPKALYWEEQTGHGDVSPSAPLLCSPNAFKIQHSFSPFKMWQIWCRLMRRNLSISKEAGCSVNPDPWFPNNDEAICSNPNRQRILRFWNMMQKYPLLEVCQSWEIMKSVQKVKILFYQFKFSFFGLFQYFQQISKERRGLMKFWRCLWDPLCEFVTLPGERGNKISVNWPIHCTALHRTTLHWTALHKAAQQGTGLHSIVLQYTTQHCTALHRNAQNCTGLHRTAQHCTFHFTMRWTTCHFTIP